MDLLDQITKLPGFQNLPSFNTLFSEINTDMGNSQIWIVLVLACLMLTFHGVAVLMIAGAFHWLDQKL
jgi:hypothetical protein